MLIRSHDEHLLEVWVPCIIVAFEEGDDDEDVAAGAVAAVASAVIAAGGKEGEAGSLARKSGISRNESPAGISLQVLLADDNAGSRDLTAEWFRREGCNVSVAVDGAEALTHIQSLEFDIVLMDILMVRGQSGHLNPRLLMFYFYLTLFRLTSLIICFAVYYCVMNTYLITDIADVLLPARSGRHRFDTPFQVLKFSAEGLCGQKGDADHRHERGGFHQGAR